MGPTITIMLDAHPFADPGASANPGPPIIKIGRNISDIKATTSIVQIMVVLAHPLRFNNPIDEARLIGNKTRPIAGIRIRRME